MLETEKDQKVTVLGKTFNSEEERRAYFREELRKHLPELKKMEGFPIGEDENILNLSDPPFYTACPNPWLNDFIAEWEEEKKHLEKEGKRNADFVVDEPYASDVSESKTHPIYVAHSYHTKVPHRAIMRYILKYTEPGDVIFDGFAGTGMTGVAASKCADIKELQQMGFKVSKDGVIAEKTLNNGVESWKPISKVGKRNALLNELAPAASFIAYNYNSRVNSKGFFEAGKKILESVTEEFKWMYSTKHSDGLYGTINYIVWSDVFTCSECATEQVLWNEVVKVEEKKVLDSFNCKQCGSLLKKSKLDRKWVTHFDNELKESISIAKQEPVLINYSHNKKRYFKVPDKEDFNLFEKINNDSAEVKVPVVKIQDGVNTRQPLRSHGVQYFHQFFTKRNLIIISRLRELAKDSYYAHPLNFWLNAANRNLSRLSKIGTGNFFNGGGGAINAGILGTLYIPSFSVESSVLKMMSERLPKIARMFLDLNDGKNVCFTQSSTKLNIKSNSIDYLFFDPPFGSNINYSELNVLWESWTGVFTNIGEEAIENSVQSKGLTEYHDIMLKCFTEAYRVLKPSKWITIEFSNTKASVWNIIQSALTRSGFVVANVSALDKKMRSFKAVVSPTAVKQDLVISCYKPSSEFDDKFKKHQGTDVAVWDFVDEHLGHLPIHIALENSTSAIIERSPKILFDRLIAYYVQKGLPVPIDAGAFQQGLRERFIERDGMFFTNEQVQEYDKKKKEHPEFIQLSILVSSEQDGVLWLKNVLTDKSLTYQDIQPLWMQALAGVRKGDVIPELADILEENFLKDEEGKWYTPDPENEADLEKLRTKRLLKQFDTYKIEAAKPNSKKIKEVRVEALRAGFKQCYQDKDFKSIVAIGDMIPNNLLMEDEVLLQFYDIASTRV